MDELRDSEKQTARVTGWYDLDDESLVKRLMARMSDWKSYWKDERERQKDDWRFKDGKQWPDEAQSRATADKRPILTLNYIDAMVRAVQGEERLNRQEIKIYGRPSHGEADDPAFGMTELIRWVMNQHDGEYAFSEAFLGSVTCGEGWVVPEVSYDEDPEGVVKVEWVDEQEILADPRAKMPDHGDGKGLIRFRMVDPDEIEAEFPGTLEKLDYWSLEHDGATWRSRDSSGYKDIYWSPSDKLSPLVFCSKTSRWLVIEHWWCEQTPGWLTIDPATGQATELTDKEKRALEKNYQKIQQLALVGGAEPPMPLPEMVKRTIKRYYMAFTVGNILLEKAPHPVPDCRRIPHIRIAGVRIGDNKNFWRGLVDGMKDAQRQFNIEQSSVVYMIQKMAKGGWKGPRGSFHDREKWINESAKPGVVLEYNAQKGEPKELAAQPIPRHLIELAQTRLAAIRDMSGVNIEMQGIRNGADPGIVIQLRKQAALTTLAVFFDNARLARKALTRVLIPYIQRFIAPNRQLLVLGPDGGARYVMMDETMRLSRYQLAADETTATPNDRVETLTLLQTILPVMLKAGVPIPPELVDLIPMPPHVREAFKAMMARQNAEMAAPTPGMDDSEMPMMEE